MLQLYRNVTVVDYFHINLGTISPSVFEPYAGNLGFQTTRIQSCLLRYSSQHIQPEFSFLALQQECNNILRFATKLFKFPLRRLNALMSVEFLCCGEDCHCPIVRL